MKKLLSLIMALAVVFTAGMISSVNKTEVKAEGEDYEEVALGFGVYAKINAETGCYDFVLYAVSREENGVIPTFSNYKLDFYIGIVKSGEDVYDDEGFAIDSDEGRQAMTMLENFNFSFTSNLSGNITTEKWAWNIREDDCTADGWEPDSCTPEFRCSIKYNGDENADFAKGTVLYGVDENNEADLNKKNHLLIIGIVSTNISPIIIQNDYGTFICDLDIYGWLEGGYMKGKKVVSIYPEFYNFLGKQLTGDFDFDGQITIKDLILGQYYLSCSQFDNNMMWFQMLTDITPGQEMEETGMRFGINSLQYLKMFLCDKISFEQMAYGMMDIGSR